jgi:arsenite-transporting ATPase
MERVFPSSRRLTRVLRPVLTKVSGGMPMPKDNVFSALERLHNDLREVRSMLAGGEGFEGTASIRLVLTPEAVVVAEARRTLTSLSLYGYRVDAVVANRLMPAGGQDDWRESWVAAQTRQMQQVRESFSPLPILIGPYQPGEPVGIDALLEHARTVYDGVDPVALPVGREPMAVERVAESYNLRLALPLADPSEVDLRRKGDDLVVTVGSHRRVLSLPVALRRCTISSAKFNEGDLVVRFDPELAGAQA